MYDNVKYNTYVYKNIPCENKERKQNIVWNILDNLDKNIM